MKKKGLPHGFPLPDRGAVTVKDYAAAYGVNPKTVYDAINRGLISVTRIGRCIRILPRGGPR